MPIMEEVTKMDHIETFKASPTIAGMFEMARKEGIEKGMEKGQLEERRRIAIELIQKGIDIQVVAETTKFSVEEINKLLKES